MLSAGTTMSAGTLYREQASWNARAVLPAEETTRDERHPSTILPHTACASSSLNVQVSISAPFSGHQPLKMMNRFSSPSAGPSAVL